MSPDQLRDFLAGRVSSWRGLSPDLTTDELTALTGAAGVPLTGRAGDPPTLRAKVSLATPLYAGGLFAWVDGDVVVALEGCLPEDAAGASLPAPELGAPDASYPAALGPLLLAGAELVYGDRGLAVRVNPDNGVLLGLVGFAPTSSEDYQARLRPEQVPMRRGIELRGVGR